MKQKRRLGYRGEEAEKKQSRKAERGEGGREGGRGQAWSPSDPFALKNTVDADHSGFLPVGETICKSTFGPTFTGIGELAKCLLVIFNLFSDMDILKATFKIRYKFGNIVCFYVSFNKAFIFFFFFV